MNKIIEILRIIKPGFSFEYGVDFVEEGVLDSIDLLNIISKIEEVFSIQIEPDEIDPDNFRSVDTIWKMIENHKK